MKLVLRDVRMPLAAFPLTVDAELTADATAVFGPSGSGKTSLLDLLAGLRRAPSAYIEIDGRVLTDTAAGREIPTRLRGIGYVPQEGALFPHLSVRKNLLYGARQEEGPFTLAHVVEVLEIAPLLDRGIGQLSGGEKQRVALGRALLSSPRLLLLDEPLAGLDLGLRARVLPYLQRARDEFGVPMLYVTHQPDEVFALCDDVLALDRGQVVGRGRPEELFVPSSRPAYELRPPER
ncbi:MAG TPA: ATP-binding cassette domain-containing protein [Thermoanaerobaculia bacterium]|nr:ATP-binding cassette domain-containing protein [Thermoanaerobaculia bacterium]